MANDYATIQDLENIAGFDAAKYGVLMQFCLDTAAEHINNFTNRPDGYLADSAASARLFVGNGSSILRIGDAYDISSIAVKTSWNDTTYTSWLTTDWLAFRGSDSSPVYGSPTLTGLPYTKIAVNQAGSFRAFTNGYSGMGWTGFSNDRYDDSLSGVYQPTVQITAKWGYALTVPATIKMATLILATRLAKRGQSAFADATGSEEFGTLRFTNEMDKDVKQLLLKGRFMKPAI